MVRNILYIPFGPLVEDFSGSTVNDATAEGGGSQGFCDDRIIALVLKSVRDGSKVV